MWLTISRMSYCERRVSVEGARVGKIVVAAARAF